MSFAPLRDRADRPSAADAGVPVRRGLTSSPPAGAWHRRDADGARRRDLGRAPRSAARGRSRDRARALAGAARRGARANPLGRRRTAVEALPDPMGMIRPSTRCEQWERQLDEIGEPLPAVEAGAPLAAAPTRRSPPSRALVHGDFRLGNFIVDEGGLAAVIDWELCSRRRSGRGHRLALHPLLALRQRRPARGGRRRRSRVARRLRGRRGRRRSIATGVRWWEAMGNVKWAVICARQAHDHLTGRAPRPELASLGRRICEPEWDLLQLIGGAADAGPADSPGAARRGRRVPVRRAARPRCRASSASRCWCRQRLRRDRPRAPGRGGARSRRTSRCSASCWARGERRARRRPPSWRGRLRAGELDDRLEELVAEPARARSRKLEVARPGYADG